MTAHIMKNKDELSRKRERLKEQQTKVTECGGGWMIRWVVKRELERCELDVCRVEYRKGGGEIEPKTTWRSSKDERRQRIENRLLTTTLGV